MGRQIIVDIMEEIIRPYPAFYIFPVAVKSLSRLSHFSLISLWFYDIVEFVLILNMHEIFVAEC